jgi:hypothetical protein
VACAKLHRSRINQIANTQLGNEPINVPESWVQFRIRDVYVPEPVQVLMELHGKELLRGRIIDLSDSEGEEDAFAVVEVEGLSQPIVVPMKHVEGILCDDSSTPGMHAHPSGVHAQNFCKGPSNDDNSDARPIGGKKRNAGMRSSERNG